VLPLLAVNGLSCAAVGGLSYFSMAVGGSG
jgi:hypothetical protein